jgi:hypothetical protein
VVAVVSFIYALYTGKRARRAAACKDFREAVHRELKGLYPRPTDWPKSPGIMKRLESVFPALQMAVANFRPFVPKKYQEDFDSAWAIYRNDTKRDIDHQSYTQYLNITSTTVNATGGETVIPNDGQANFKRHVDKLLSFAQDV